MMRGLSFQVKENTSSIPTPKLSQVNPRQPFSNRSNDKSLKDPTTVIDPKKTSTFVQSQILFKENIVERANKPKVVLKRPGLSTQRMDFYDAGDAFYDEKGVEFVDKDLEEML